MRSLVLLSMIALAIGGCREGQEFSAPSGNEPAAQIQIQLGHAAKVISVAFSPDGKLALSGSDDKTVKLWDVASGLQLRIFTGAGEVHAVAFSPDGRLALSGNVYVPGGLGELKLWDVSTGRELRRFGSPVSFSDNVDHVAFSSDGKLALSGAGNNVRLLDVASGHQLRRFTRGENTPFLFSPDGKQVLSVSERRTLILRELATGRELMTFAGHTDNVTSLAFSPDGRLALSGGGALKLWEVATGRELRTFTGHAGWVSAVAVSPDGRLALSGGMDGTTRLWDLQSGAELATMIGSSDGNELAITPKGFFTASQRDTEILALVRGLEATTIGQVHQSLYNPDLVREVLAGDPDGEVKRAAEVINLDKVLDAGPPPAVAITSHEPGRRSGKDAVTIAARITERDKGVGRIEWRLNGVTAGVMTAPAGTGLDHDVTRDLALDPGENRIEVIAYEGRNLLASPPARTAIFYDGLAETAKPKLHILAIGINKYVDQGGNYGRFPPLIGSVPDAQAFSAELEKAGAGQYEKVRVTLALDENATLGKLDEAVTKIASEISPRDTFVLYAAAHGYSLGGNYYMIPQDFQGGGDPAALKSRAISQERMQEWLATRITAKRALILLDTCESGALTGGYIRSRTVGTVSEAAVGRLHEATGRPVITAASPGKSAYEDYKGHGVFTYALIEALHKSDTNNNGKIEVTELAAHVEQRVPELFAELKQSGRAVKGLAAARGSGGDAQTAHFGSTGEDFALVARLP